MVTFALKSIPDDLFRGAKYEKITLINMKDYYITTAWSSFYQCDNLKELTMINTYIYYPDLMY